jgi:hypothetical protein
MTKPILVIVERRTLNGMPLTVYFERLGSFGAEWTSVLTDARRFDDLAEASKIRAELESDYPDDSYDIVDPQVGAFGRLI